VFNQQSETLINSHSEPTVSQGYKFNWFDWFCLWYPPGWLILFNRHWQHYHQDPDGWNWLEYLLFLIPGGFYLAFLSRWLRLGCRSPRTEVEEFNPNYQQAFRAEILAPIVQHYFRGELQQLENLPSTGPMIVTMNHAGMSFPWDFISLGYLLGETRGWVAHPIAEGSLFEHPWMVWWLPPKWSQVLGAVRAELKDFEAAVAQGKILLYAPEGIRGPLKGWRKRYQLQKFNVSFLQLSDRYHIPILPVVCIGSENLHPWTINLKGLQKLTKLPFCPISPLMLALILFPSMGVWAMRTRLRYFIQPVETECSSDSQQRKVVYQRAKQFQERLQFRVDELLNKNLPVVE
jgi:1-acyl-sn-glycerol-3-phosphate acyltransferase